MRVVNTVDLKSYGPGERPVIGPDVMMHVPLDMFVLSEL